MPRSGLLYLHRAYCTRALREHPEEPLKSRYAPSFVAAYRSSIDVLHRIRKVFMEQPDVMMRFWMFSAHAISAAVSVEFIFTVSTFVIDIRCFEDYARCFSLSITRFQSVGKCSVRVSTTTLFLFFAIRPGSTDIFTTQARSCLPVPRKCEKQ